jgi:hypothetical protein
MSNKILFENSFGIITETSAILKYNNGTKSFSIAEISYVSFQKESNTLSAIFGLVVTIAGLLLLSSDINMLSVFVSVFGILILLANYLGHHNIVINIQGADQKPLKVEMAKTKEGKDFVVALSIEIEKRRRK